MDEDSLEDILREFQDESFSQVYVNYGGADLEFDHPRENSAGSSDLPGPSTSQITQPSPILHFNPHEQEPSISQITVFDPNQPGPSNAQENVSFGAKIYSIPTVTQNGFEFEEKEADGDVLEPPPAKKFSISTIIPSSNQQQYASELDFLNRQINSTTSENMVFRRRNYLAPGELATQKCLENSMPFADVELLNGACRTAPLPPDNLIWPFYLAGAPGTPYEKAKFFGKLNFSRDTMDTCPPHVKFDTIFFHPDCCRDGNLDMRELAKDWNSQKSIVDVFEHIWHKMRNCAAISATRSLRDYYQPDLAAHAKFEPKRFLIFIAYVTKHTNCE
ncbi:unnamed protein product [Caenorhabditis angaria]|uniref:UBC core domain-containing protein n=1 Tax=Caenorhabditis angaria TaxID=860376 RepID=A0A9P1I847_9PELO|nr:unnamed protein product [Caenorhabditis angaria]